MVNNNIKTTLRYLWRNKLFTILNIVGLSIGISACWMVFSIVHYEFSFDKEIPDVADVYQIVSENEFQGKKGGSAGIPMGMAPLLAGESLDGTLKLIDLATGVTIFISCLGSFGLATLTAFQRTKEIGVRKVLGASVTGIVGLLSKDFVKLVVIAIVIASPIAWYAMNDWLADFAYRIAIQWWMFALAGLLALIVALLTMSYQAIRAARVNPVDSLRDE